MEKGIKIDNEKIEETLTQECKLIIEEQRKLAAEKVFIPSPKESKKIRLNGRIYGIFIDQEILFSKIGEVLGIPVKILSQQEGNHLFNQSLLRRGFFELTGFPAYWDNLQWILDYVSTYVYGKKEGYEFDSFTERKVRTLYQQIDFRLKGALDIAFMNYGTSSPNQIIPSEYKKRINNYREMMRRDFFPFASEAIPTMSEFEDIVPAGLLDEHKINIGCKPVEKSKKLI